MTAFYKTCGINKSIKKECKLRLTGIEWKNNVGTVYDLEFLLDVITMLWTQIVVMITQPCGCAKMLNCIL